MFVRLNEGKIIEEKMEYLEREEFQIGFCGESIHSVSKEVKMSLVEGKYYGKGR